MDTDNSVGWLGARVSGEDGQVGREDGDICGSVNSENKVEKKEEVVTQLAYE